MSVKAETSSFTFEHQGQTFTAHRTISGERSRCQRIEFNGTIVEDPTRYGGHETEKMLSFARQIAFEILTERVLGAQRR